MASNTSTAAFTHNFLCQRLLQDIKELQDKPYPGIAVHIQDDDMTKACLVVRPENERPLHMTMYFPKQYPLEPPEISMDSKNVLHPNIFDDYICINILKGADGYTPAYTLKGICIQMLSFFASAKIDQDEGYTVDRAKWAKVIEEEESRWGMLRRDTGRFECKKCDFGCATTPGGDARPCDTPMSGTSDVKPPTPPNDQTATDSATEDEGGKKAKLQLVDLPEDVLLLFCDYLEEEDLFLAARAWNGFSRLIRRYNIIRTRELQCFTLKRGFKDLDLGIGVHATTRPRAIKSEFDLISRDAYDLYDVRRSIQGLRFEYWLPLPISEKHWDRVRKDIDERLNAIARAGGVDGTLDTVIYNFMNEIVVQLSTSAAELESRQTPRHVPYLPSYMRQDAPKSTLTHASEKAIEGYFQLFHLLLCLAIERPSIVEHANSMLKKFIDGQRDKQAVPNLGHLLIMILISDVDVSEELTKALIKEAVTRNVVWMLEPLPKGKGMLELSFMETSAISDYRLERTFIAGKTSYRLFMFLNLMRKIVNQARTFTDKDGNTQKMTLQQLRDELFRRHGAPPNGAAASMAQAIRDIQYVSNFPQFLANMGLPMPNKANFTTFLRQTVKDSMDKGYSRWALQQDAALDFRLVEDPNVEVPEGMQPRRYGGGASHLSFFPDGGRGGGRGGRGDRGGRGGGRGRDRGRGGY
ncbi:hypothetical protein M409DRAFT_55727 [Zasmidium cellare ATCC 36951]|uniref:UBC core domain-containing protein n=1 Tax=Zasmidium cellare ATCC 36951 TaxID=1080233 RepID=A0A6A6CHZ1_ZASCE|nr:uncharacterized protein M409DRAFT_55727 [Zasmidium cellare ATCC 36951]KAF2165309.1 hypothetical protein M409DRAFT_55727 [Zasmidium cellare ATCC 36951]